MKTLEKHRESDSEHNDIVFVKIKIKIKLFSFQRKFDEMGGKQTKQKDLLEGSAWLRTVVQHYQVNKNNY